MREDRVYVQFNQTPYVWSPLRFPPRQTHAGLIRDGPYSCSRENDLELIKLSIIFGLI